MIIFLLIWMIGAYLLWLRAHIVLNNRGTLDVVGEYKAVFELACAMQAQLEDTTKEEGHDVSSLTEAQLRRRITKDLLGGSISYKPSLRLDEDCDDMKADKTGWGFKLWWRKEKWWFMGMLVAMGSWIATVIMAPHVLFGWVLPLVWLFAMFVSSSWKSRAVLLFWLLLILGAVPTICTTLIPIEGWNTDY
jgi:hypothetical protein